MHKRDYVAIAGVVRYVDQLAGETGAAWADVSGELEQRLADVFAADNPRFDRARFGAACFTGAAPAPVAAPVTCPICKGAGAHTLSCPMRWYA